jgi:hypothetical protein
VVAPVFVIPAPASTTKLSAVPSGTEVAAACALPESTSSPAENDATTIATAAAPKRSRLAFAALQENFIFSLSLSVGFQPPAGAER